MMILKKTVYQSKNKEIFNGLIKERRETMNELHSLVDFDQLLYHYKGPTKDKDFGAYNNVKSLFNMIKDKDKDISLSHAEENQAEFKRIKIRGKKSSTQKKVIKNVEKFRDS